MHYRRQTLRKKTIKDGDKERQPRQGQEESDRDRGKRDKYEGCGGFGSITFFNYMVWYGMGFRTWRWIRSVSAGWLVRNIVGKRFHGKVVYDTKHR